MFGKPVIQEVNGAIEDAVTSYRWLKPFGRILAWNMNISLRMASEVIVVTEQLAKYLAHCKDQSRIHVVPNAANTTIFHPGAVCAIKVPRNSVVFFGAFSPWQGIETMLAATKTAAWPNEATLVMVGDGKLRNRVEEEARSNPRILYLGRLPYTQVAGVVSQCLASIMVKGGEGLGKSGLSPLKLYESLACAVPVIVSDIAGQADFVRENDCGVVIPEGTPIALAQSVAACLSQPQDWRAKGQRGWTAVRTQHSWKARAQQTLGIIASAGGDK